MLHTLSIWEYLEGFCSTRITVFSTPFTSRVSFSISLGRANAIIPQQIICYFCWEWRTSRRGRCLQIQEFFSSSHTYCWSWKGNPRFHYIWLGNLHHTLSNGIIRIGTSTVLNKRSFAHSTATNKSALARTHQIVVMWEKSIYVNLGPIRGVLGVSPTGNPACLGRFLVESISFTSMLK